MADEHDDTYEAPQSEVALIDKAGTVHEVVIDMPPIEGVSSLAVTVDDPFTTPNEAVMPPANLHQLTQITQEDSMRRAILQAIALNTMGLGVTVEPAPGFTREGIEQDQTDLLERLDRCAQRDRRMDGPDFLELMQAVKYDEEECGQGCVEVSRSRLTGEIDGLFHVPGHRVRRLKDRTGYLYLASPGLLDEGQRFYNFGEKVQYDAQSAPQPKVQAGKFWARNELIVFRMYTSESNDYGLPRDVGMALEYLGDKLAAESNISFFDSAGTPPSIVFVQGEERKDGSRTTISVPRAVATRIANTLKSDGSHRHRVAVIPLPPGAVAQKIELGHVNERDMGFTNYRVDLRRRKLSAFRMSPIFIPGEESKGRFTAEVERAITLEQLFDPEQNRYERRLRATLLKDLGYFNRRLKFKRLAVEADAARRAAAIALATASAITNEELRLSHGFPPLPEAQTEDPVAAAAEGKVILGWNKMLVSMAQPGAPGGPPQPQDQRGLQPGLAGRAQRQAPNGDGPGAADRGVAGLKDALGGPSAAGIARAAAAAASAGNDPFAG